MKRTRNLNRKGTVLMPACALALTVCCVGCDETGPVPQPETTVENGTETGSNAAAADSIHVNPWAGHEQEAEI